MFLVSLFDERTMVWDANGQFNHLLHIAVRQRSVAIPIHVNQNAFAPVTRPSLLL